MAGQFSFHASDPSTLDPARHGICRTAWAGRHAAEGLGQATNGYILQESLGRSTCGRIRASRLAVGSETAQLHPARAVCRSTGNDDIGDALQAHHTDVNGSHPPGASTAQRVLVMGDAKGMGGKGARSGQVVWWCVSVAVISKNTAIQSGSQRRPRNMHPADLVPVHRPRCRWHNQSPLFLRQIHPQFP